MKLIVENFRGIKNADIDLSPKVTLIAGRNGAGKTSVIQALQALVTQETIPISKLKKKDAKLLINQDEKSGHAFLGWNGKETRVKWPSCVFSGQMFPCSVYAARVVQPAAIQAKDLTSILNVLPTYEDLKGEFPADVGVPVAVVWKTITKSGWDIAHDQAAEKGRALKREWEKLAGENWGSDKAKGWVPEFFVEKSLEELETGLRTAEKLFEHAVKAQALNEKEREDLQKVAESFDETQKTITSLNSEISNVEVQISKAQALMEQIPKILNKQQAYQCWSCNSFGVIQQDKLVEAPDSEQTEEDIAALRQRIAEQNQNINALTEQRNYLNLYLREARANLTKAEEAKKKLKAVVLDDEPTPLSVEDARAEVELARKRLTAHKIKNECDEICTLLGMNQYIVAVLSPDGLRKQVLSAKLATFNDLLSVVCDIAAWPKIELDEFLDIRFNGRPYVLLSVGEQFAVNTALQLAVAKMDESKMIIIDGIDVLDRYLLNGLMAILDNIPIPSVVGCKFNNIEDVPDLGSLGIAYWCESGMVTRIERKG